ncbi:MAG: CbtA family protein, partial [Rhodobacteraceae bacterium]|nr:CbtA family protein [Paracoccaceae bacterium]
WAADLAARQYWQIFAILATLAGLVGIGFGKNWLAWGVGILLIATPHILGAPHPTEFGGVVPPELSAHFASLSLSVGAIGWSFLGLFAGYLWAKQTPT